MRQVVPLCASRLAAIVRILGRLHAPTAFSCLLLVVFVGVGLRVEPVEAATCTESLQARIDAATSGGTVLAEPCTYREQIIIEKPITLVGQPGSEIRGSDVWQGWRKKRGGRWVSALSVPALPQDQVNVFCMLGTSRCKLPEQVFFDGKPLIQVTSPPTKANQFFVNADRKVILMRDPRGHTLEVTTRQHWVLGTSSADGVSIEGWAMKHAGTEGRSAALMNRPEVEENGGERWTVKNSVLSDGHAAIISLTGAPSHEILGNKILRAGMLGIKGAGRGSVIRGNEVAYGNTERYCYDANCGIGETGGVKFARVSDTIFDQNVVHDNFGKGVHYDIGCANNIASNNRVYDNARIGLHMELCYSGKMFGNTVFRNGYATPESNKGAGILTSSSENIEIYDNVVAYNPGGIAIQAFSRPDHELTHDVFVHHNTIISQAGFAALAWKGQRDAFTLSANNNRGSDNRYHYPVAENGDARFFWDGAIIRLNAFNSTGGEENGYYLTAAQKDAVLAEHGIPSRAK